MNEKYLKNLSEEEKYILRDKGTEKPFSGVYNNFYDAGVFICRACKSPLYESNTKFNSGCGWPSFDDQIDGAINCYEDLSGGRVRTEICCAKCDGHLGHVFHGENLTIKNTRHCVNSLSIQFKPYKNLELSTLAGGNFWYLDKLYRNLTGVYLLHVGYMGGKIEHSTYEQVQSGKTNHSEVVQIYFEPSIISYRHILSVFFNHCVYLNKKLKLVNNWHKPIIYFNSKEQKEQAENLLSNQSAKTSCLATIQVKAETVFFRAEEQHQNYINKKNL